MAKPAIMSVEAVEAKRVRLLAYGVEWDATLVPDGGSTRVLLRGSGRGTPRLVTSLPAGSVSCAEDLAFALARPEVAFAMGDIAREDAIPGFDGEAYAADGLCGAKVTLEADGAVSVRYGDEGTCDLLGVVTDVADAIRRAGGEGWA